MDKGTTTAQKRWEVENDVQEAGDDIYKYIDQDDILSGKPWTKDPHYFKNVKISAIALLKMLIHTRDGLSADRRQPDLEVMGLMQGRLDGDTIVVLDSFGVTKGNEIRVTAGVADSEYMINYIDAAAKVGKREPPVGWYHSHPGFGCWLSGVDVNTQFDNQLYMDPMVAIVIDPKRTMSSGRVEIKAFRAWPKDYQVPEHLKNKVPKNKKEKEFEFGIHSHRYYELKISVFKSNLDALLLSHLWTKYWVKSLASSRNIFNRDFDSENLEELNDKILEAEKTTDKQRGMHQLRKNEKEESELSIAADSACDNAIESLNGFINQLLKHQLFNTSLVADK